MAEADQLGPLSSGLSRAWSLRDQIVAGDIAGSSAGELIRFFDDVVVILEKG
jgi:hypothetical protein